jgi:hypothetical protein
MARSITPVRVTSSRAGLPCIQLRMSELERGYRRSSMGPASATSPEVSKKIREEP